MNYVEAYSEEYIKPSIPKEVTQGCLRGLLDGEIYVLTTGEIVEDGIKMFEGNEDILEISYDYTKLIKKVNDSLGEIEFFNPEGSNTLIGYKEEGDQSFVCTIEIKVLI